LVNTSLTVGDSSSFWGMMARSNLTLSDLQREVKEDDRFVGLIVQLFCAKVARIGQYGILAKDDEKKRCVESHPLLDKIFEWIKTILFWISFITVCTCGCCCCSSSAGKKKSSSNRVSPSSSSAPKRPLARVVDV
ncbi:hypothetical protein PMAYCL1PPCAC_21559, partial [Pristionchus mayeri]